MLVGPDDMHDYTIQADLRGQSNRKRWQSMATSIADEAGHCQGR